MKNFNFRPPVPQRGAQPTVNLAKHLKVRLVPLPHTGAGAPSADFTKEDRAGSADPARAALAKAVQEAIVTDEGEPHEAAAMIKKLHQAGGEPLRKATS